jgi:hypothetical protein
LASPSFAPSSKLTAGYIKVPTHFIENLGAFKPAEVAFSLVYFRRAGELGADATIPDTVWQKWTGYSPRQKEYALHAMQAKGMSFEGRGDKTRYSITREQWMEALLKHEPSVYDPKRKERDARAVAAKAGAKVHEECRDQGCSMLRGNCPNDEAAKKQSSPLLVMPNAQPVAQTPHDRVFHTKVGSSPAEQAEKQVSPSAATKLAQPVAQTARTAGKKVEQLFALTMATLQSFFPLVAALFLTRLLTAVRKSFPDISDAELAQAVKIAFVPGRQRSEGLFLTRVPEALEMIRRKEKQQIAAAIARGTPSEKPDPTWLKECHKVLDDPSQSELMKALARDLMKSS